MDPALKQRLVGAAVLVALAVIFVPMLLEAPEPEATPAGQLPLDMPDRPTPSLQTRDVPLTLPQPAAQPTPADPNAVATVDVDSAPRVDALEGADAAAAAQPVAPQPTAPSPTAPALPTSSATQPAAAPSPVAAVEPPPAAPVAAPPPPSTSAPATGRFIVNLGSYGNIANAKALNRRLAQRGFPIRSERIEIDGKPAQRLRAGPFRTRAEAEAAALKLGQAEPGARFSVGELEDAEPVAATAKPAVAQGFAVQLGAFKDESEASALRDRLRKAGFTAYTERASTDAGSLWRVRAGPELQRDRAEQVRNRIKEALKLDGIVVRHP
ncbi:SPOR domain-containing protein [Pseudomarimonas salicorniae]|uniref:SPOR domain-containing protein n=1 Tax=Pseudomarimonas salicorniae TaxID=2933270 RepID=A0ABT0GIK3_9GAMM|nr:SPOR domain-containing protein [Lysobacter sp. CAU 1642]MCK7593835.1 SPOR domain-containing protein [Lysobacter sp. CAU 1642]